MPRVLDPGTFQTWGISIGIVFTVPEPPLKYNTPREVYSSCRLNAPRSGKLRYRGGLWLLHEGSSPVLSAVMFTLWRPRRLDQCCGKPYFELSWLRRPSVTSLIHILKYLPTCTRTTQYALLSQAELRPLVSTLYNNGISTTYVHTCYLRYEILVAPDGTLLLHKVNSLDELSRILVREFPPARMLYSLLASRP